MLLFSEKIDDELKAKEEESREQRRSVFEQQFTEDILAYKQQGSLSSECDKKKPVPCS